MTNQEQYPPTETTKERFSSWRKPLAVTAMGIAALSACSSDVEAQPNPTEPTPAVTETETPEPTETAEPTTEPTNEESDSSNSSENDDWDPEAYEGDVTTFMLSPNQSAELMERMSYPFPDCDNAAEGEICIEEWNHPGYILHNGADIVTEWAQEQGSDAYNRIAQLRYYPADLPNNPNDDDLISVVRPLDRDE